MPHRDRASTAGELLRIAKLAAREVMAVYAGEFAVDYKGPHDPVTVADRRANAIIVEGLTAAFPGVPIVAEESDPTSFSGFHEKREAFFVDPLDGTREFVAKNGEFAVMIGFAEEGRATLGVVDCAALGRVFVGGEGVPAMEIARDGASRPIRVSVTDAIEDAWLLLSRSRPMPEIVAAVLPLGLTHVRRPGSAGLKAALVAAGEGDVFAHRGTAGSRWDSCAPEAIVRAAGGVFTDGRGRDIDYKSPDLVNADGVLAANPSLHAKLLPTLRPILAPPRGNP